MDLTEADPETKSYTRSIVKTLDPHKYHVNIVKHFL